MRWLGALVLGIVVVVGLLTMLGRGPTVPGLGLGAAQLEASENLGYSAQDARLVQTGDDGAPLYTLDAQVMRRSPSSEDIEAEGLTLRYSAPEQDPARPWVLTARNGVLPAGSSTVQLKGQVRLTGRPPGAAEDLRLETPSLSFDLQAQVAQTTQSVVMWSGPRRLTARGLSADLKQGKVRLESSVHGRFPP